MNASMLRGKIIERGLNVESVAEKIGIDRSSLYRKLNDGEKMTLKEAVRIRNLLDLSDEEATLIFLR